MSQFGMNMPGGQGRRSPQLNVYTGLLFLACVCLAAACVTMYFAGAKIGVNGDPFAIQNAKQGIKLSK
ncbi:MAG: hypothetical protein AB7K52_05985 [Phycisphaerales bacterium]